MADGVGTDDGGTSLIRQEVIDARQASTLGAVRLVTPVSALMLAGLGLVLVTTLLIWLCLGHYTRRVHVTGNLAPIEGLAPIAATASGTVTRLLIHDGDTVVPGTPLLMITQEADAASMGETRKSISATLEQSQRSLADDMETTSRLADDQAKALETSHASLQRQVSQVDAQIDLWSTSTTRQAALLDRIHSKVASGIVSDVQLQQLESQQDTAKAQVASLTRDKFQLQQQLADNDAQRRQLPMDTMQKRGDLQRKLLDSRQLLLQSEAGRLLVIRSEIAGTVANVLVHTGQSVASGRDLLTLLPAKSHLQAELLVPSEALGFLSTGERVVLHYSAYSYQKFGPARGSVSHISRSAFSPDDQTQLFGQQDTKDPIYRVTVDLDKQSVSAYGTDRPLTAGMAVDADILIERRRMIEWVLEPLYGMTRR